MTKQKSPKANKSSSELLQEALYIITGGNVLKLQEAMYLASPHLGQVSYKINPQMQDFKRVLNLFCKKRED